MELSHNVVGWFEIPVSNMERAIKFYKAVFGIEFSRDKLGPLDTAFFPHVGNGIGTGGSLVHHKEYYHPSADGVLIYFTAFSGDLNNELEKIEKEGGTVLQPKTLITEEIGHMAIFLDTEGNRIALHSRR
jgi:uncharacterized protein